MFLVLSLVLCSFALFLCLCSMFFFLVVQCCFLLFLVFEHFSSLPIVPGDLYVFIFHFLIPYGSMFEFGFLRPTQSNSCLTLEPLQSKSTLVKSPLPPPPYTIANNLQPPAESTLVRLVHLVHLVRLILQLPIIYDLWLKPAVPLLLLSKVYRWLYLLLDYHPDILWRNKKYLLLIRNRINHNSPESIMNLIFKLRYIFTFIHTFLLFLRDDI